MTISVDFTPREIEVLSHALIMLGGRCNDRAKSKLGDGEKYPAFLEKMYADEVFDLVSKLPDAHESAEEHDERRRRIDYKYDNFGDIYLASLSAIR